MTIRVCSLMWGTAWERYGKMFAESFARHWPEAVELVVATDRGLPLPRGRQIALNDVPGYPEFVARYGDDRKAQGFDSGHHRVDARGYSWRHDALKWAPQGLAPRAGVTHLKDGDIFVWLDADVETLKPVPEDWIEGLLDGHDVACLQRPGTHSEIGFWAMRMKPETRNVIWAFALPYASGRVFEMREFHSAYVWDRALATEPGLKVRNLTPPNCRPRKGHVWPHTPLAEFTAHHKGNLKPR